MDKTPKLQIQGSLAVAGTLMRLLQGLDNSTLTIGADQYRSVVQHLIPELLALQGDVRLEPLLQRYPAAAEMYENLCYANAGLCRSPLDPALQAELQARAAIDRAKQGTDKRNIERGISNGQT